MLESIKLIKELISAKWWGKLTLSFEGGKITLARKEETIQIKE